MIFDKKALNYLLSTCLLLIAYFTYFRAYQFPDLTNKNTDTQVNRNMNVHSLIFFIILKFIYPK